jgi:photosystem II stability/assembly factor-like uncharacterized protein
MRFRISVFMVLMVGAGLALIGQPAVSATLFGLVDTGELFVSVDQGSSWAIRSELPVRDAVAIGAGGSSADLFLAVRSGALYRSSDAGLSWEIIGSIPASDVVDLKIRTDLSVWLLTRSGEVYRSTDHGVEFTLAASLPSSDCVSLARTTSDQDLLLMTRTGDVFASSSSGEDWMSRGAIPASNLVSLQALDDALYALAATGEIHRSVDGGASWTEIGTLSQLGASSLTRDGSSLLASLTTGEVAGSPDGIAWSWRGSMQQLAVAALGVDTPATSSIVSPASGVAPILLGSPQPNPARVDDGFTVRLRLPTASEVDLRLHDVTGRLVSWKREHVEGGDSTIHWSPRVPRSGLFLIRAQASGGLAGEAKILLMH